MPLLSWPSGFVWETDLVNQPNPCSSLLLKPFESPKLTFCSSWLSVVQSVPRPTGVSKGRFTLSIEMQAGWNLGIQVAPRKVCSQATSREKMGDGHFCLFPLSWAWLYIYGEEDAPKPIKILLICYSPMKLLNASSVGRARWPCVLLLKWQPQQPGCQMCAQAFPRETLVAWNELEGAFWLSWPPVIPKCMLN